MTVINKHHHGGAVPPGAVNVMRGTPFGNPFAVTKETPRGVAIRKFEAWLYARLPNDPAFCRQLVALHGRDLCCCCAPLACHADVLERVASELHAAGWR